MAKKPTYEELEKKIKDLENRVNKNKQAEKSLQEIEERFKETVELLPNIVCEYNANGRFTYVNSYGLKSLGYTIADLEQGLYAKQVFPKAEIIKFKERFNFLLKGNKQDSTEYRVICKDGSMLEVIANSSPIYKDGKIVGGRSSVTPITELKQIERALRESEEKYKELANSLPQVIFETDAKGNITFANRLAFKIFNSTQRDFQKGLNALDMIAPEDRNRALENIQRILGGEIVGDCEYTAMRKDGSTFPIIIHSSRIDSDKGPNGLRGIIIDITDRKRAEEEKARLESQLQRAEKMEAVGTLAGGVAHDLNNILSGIVSYPDLLLMQVHKDSPLRKPIITIQETGKKAAAIVQDLLTLARRGVTTTDVINLNDILSDYLSSPEYEKLEIFHPEVQLETNFEPDLLNILGSSVHLSKTIMNLISNAAEAIQGLGKIIVTTENRYIDEPITGYDDVKEGDYVVLSVSDTGVGISSEDRERIFEPFFTKKVMGRSGTGLGMAVVWGTVKDHKGYIDLQSTEGQGTAFTLYFPATRRELDKEEITLSIEAYRGNKESILVVDDVEEQREIATMILTHLGYSTTTASSGEEAVEYLRNNKVDLLVLDMIMNPKMDGFETYSRILEIHPGQKAIITSGFSETERVKAAQRLGAGQYVKKPYTLEKLGVAVRNELDD